MSADERGREEPNLERGAPLRAAKSAAIVFVYPRTKKERLKYYIILFPLLRKSSSRFAGGGPNETSPPAIGCINDPNRIHHDGPP
eukprot:5599292-Prymnesium_polylepis.1